MAAAVGAPAAEQVRLAAAWVAAAAVVSVAEHPAAAAVAAEEPAGRTEEAGWPRHPAPGRWPQAMCHSVKMGKTGR